MTTTCDCPFCPLTDINLHIDDVLVISKGRGGTSVHTPSIYRSSERLTDDTAKHFITITILAIQNGVKVGEEFEGSCDDYTLIVRRVSKTKTAVSFHTKHKEEEATDPV